MKKFLSLLLSAIMTVSMCTVSSVSAYDTDTLDSQAQTHQLDSSDSVYGDFNYEVFNNTVTITKYTGSATTVSIPSKIEGKLVTSIGAFAFEDCSSLMSVEIPNSVTSIGYCAFYDCSSLKSVTIPNSVTSIRDCAFAYCNSLTSVTIGNSVTSIGDGAFSYCSSLTNINVDGNNTDYSSTDVVLFNKNKTTLICYPAGNKNISYTIPNSVTSISEGAFGGCSSLTSVMIPNSVKSIGSHAFYECSSLTSVKIPNSVKSIEKFVFFYCSSLTNVEIPNSVTSIGSSAFEGCSSLTSVEIPNSVTSIGEKAFGYYYDGGYKKIDRFSIKGTKGSAAESYANENGFTFVDSSTIPTDGNHTYFAVGDANLFNPAWTPNSTKFQMTQGDDGIYSVIIPVTDIQWENPFEYKVAQDGNWNVTFNDMGNCEVGSPNAIGFIDVGTGYIKIIFNPSTLRVSYECLPFDTVEVTRITLNKTSTTITKGNSETLTATITPSNATNKTVTWTTSNSSVATVSGGKVTAVSTGTATITAKSNNGKTATCNVTVINPTVEVTGITLNKTSVTITKGNSETLTATITPSNATNKTVTWTTSNSSVATVSGGKVTAVSKGTATITAKSNNGKTATCNVTVVNPTVEVTGITLNKTALTLETGKSETLIATITPSNATNKTVTWSTSNSSVATVSNGTVKAVSAGTAIITAKTNNGKTATCKVTIVNPPVAVTGISLNKTTLSLDIGKSETLIATVTPSNATNKTVTWSTSNSSVATVSNGTVKAVSTGTATITAKTNNGKTATCKVTVISKNSPFEWGKDNWNFMNHYDYFGYTTYRKQIDSDYVNVLKKNLTNSEYNAVFGTRAYYGWIDDMWGGSCYGMSSLTLLSKNGNLLPFNNYKSGATKLNDLNYPLSSRKVSSLITYYQMLQVKAVIQQQYRTVPNQSNKTNIENIISLLNRKSTVLLGFSKANWGGHAILAYGYEYGSYTFSGVTYQGCIKICDPNFSKAYDKNANIYFNTSSYNWCIPAYNYAEMLSVKGAKFNYIGADINEINEGGYLSASFNNGTTDSFIARIDAIAISSENRFVSKVVNNDGLYFNRSSAPGEIIEDYSYVSAGDSKGIFGYNLYDSKSAYRVIQENAEELNLKMDYEKCDLAASSKAGKNVVFDPKGFVSVEGESADYSLSMVFDEDYPTDWFAVSVKGSETNKASLEKAENGYILSSDNLKNVSVDVNNKEIEAERIFTTTYPSVYIYEKNLNTIGLKVDTDNNGTYETELSDTPKDPTSVSLNKSSLIVGVGEKFKFQAKVPDGENAGTFTYTSSKSAVATIDKNGNLTAKATGTTIITVTTYNGKTAKCRVTVKNAPTDISINRKNSIMGLGETFYLEGSLANDEASRVLTFSSNNPEVATVTNGGIVTAKSVGTAIVSITTYNGQKATCRVTVRNAPTSLQFNKTSITLKQGETFYLESQFNTGEYARTVIYNSPNKAVATISGSGVIMAKSKGTVKITGKTYNGKTQTCTVTVK